MSDRLLYIVTFGSTLGCGLAAGVSFAALMTALQSVRAR
jgi:hypothetical protein